MTYFQGFTVNWFFINFTYYYLGFTCKSLFYNVGILVFVIILNLHLNSVAYIIHFSFTIKIALLKVYFLFIEHFYHESYHSFKITQILIYYDKRITFLYSISSVLFLKLCIMHSLLHYYSKKNYNNQLNIKKKKNYSRNTE